jgi:hypothetical protein
MNKEINRQGKPAKLQEYAFLFTFSVPERDSMYFARVYSYTYTDLNTHLMKLGDIRVPAIFWDADKQLLVDMANLFDRHKVAYDAPPVRVEEAREFSETLLKLLRHGPLGVIHSGKPVVIIAGQIHPGKTNFSFAMEGFMNVVFRSSQIGARRFLRCGIQQGCKWQCSRVVPSNTARADNR